MKTFLEWMGNHGTFVLQGDSKNASHSIYALNMTTGLRTFIDPGDLIRNIYPVETLEGENRYSLELSRDQGGSWTRHEVEEKEFDRVKHMLKPA